jgi:hypothetical protein
MTGRKLSPSVLAFVLAAGGCGGPRENAASSAPRAAGMVKALAADEGEGRIMPIGEVPREYEAITGRIWRLAARARRLKPKEPVKLKVLPPKDLVAVVRRKVAEDIPKDQIRGEGRVYAALGLVPPDYDYEAETFALLEEELAGLYVPEEKTMFLAARIEGEELVATLSHELVHALQDQHFGLGDRMKYRPGESDALAALHALAEGDATSAMIDELVLEREGEAALAARNSFAFDKEAEDLASGGSRKKNSRIANAPRFISVGLLAPYADGMRFVHAMRQRGGWRAVDAVWAKPPTTTEQLLHPEKYDAGEPAIAVAPATGNALGPGFQKTYDEIFGEQEGRIAFAEWMDVPTSKKAAAGWGGDRVTLFESGEDRAVSWRIVFDDLDEAREAFGLLDGGWSGRFGVANLSQGSLTEGALRVWGAVASEPAKDAKKPAGKKEPAKKEPPKETLPQLPDAPGAPAGKASAVALRGCRAMRLAGRAVTLLAGVPCKSVVAWANEVGGAP